MGKQDAESQTLQVLKEKDSIELTVPPCTNATQLSRFMCWLEEIFYSNYHSAGIMRTVGSFNQETLITFLLGTSSAADILDKIREMPEVEKVEEEPLVSGVFSRFHTRFARFSTSSISSSRRFRLTLKENSLARQELVTA